MGAVEAVAVRVRGRGKMHGATLSAGRETVIHGTRSKSAGFREAGVVMVMSGAGRVEAEGQGLPTKGPGVLLLLCCYGCLAMTGVGVF